MRRTVRLLVPLLLLLAGLPALFAETVAQLPAPTGYVNDFAQVLSPGTRQRVEDLCTAVDRQAHAQIAVVTIRQLENDQSIEEFATELEEKWKVGTKGSDRGVLMVLSMQPRRGRIEVGYGLEGILNDAKVGDIGRAMQPDAAANDYNAAIPLGVNQIAQVIAKDAGVALTLPQHQYRRQQSVAAQPLTLGQMLLYGGIALVVLFVVVRGGGSGLLWFLLGNMLGGGWGGGGGGGFRGGGGRDRDDDGGGFGGFGGGSSGGGGASGDF